jgi:hypothetical protein
MLTMHGGTRSDRLGIESIRLTHATARLQPFHAVGSNQIILDGRSGTCAQGCNSVGGPRPDRPTLRAGHIGSADLS